ncbi:MAG: flagellar basal-body MS-ring/collar protein FliF [Gammaproteobacteria bacterium]
MTDATTADSVNIPPPEASADQPGAAQQDKTKAGGDKDKAPGLIERGTEIWENLARKPLIMAAIAAGVAAIIGLLWFSTGDEAGRTLYYGLEERDTSAIIEQLEKAAIPYELDSMGNIRVPQSKIYDARLKVASAGLPRGTGKGLEFLDEPPEIGRSQFTEQARYHHALERELAKSISSLGSIERARVHLALPKKSVFIRERSKPSASVVVHLYPGRVLDEGQVAAITHLISSSVPGMTNDGVTVVDQRGKMISRQQGTKGMSQSFERMDYTRQLEEHYIRRIEELLAPMVGHNQVRAQVSAEVDFTVQEATSETYDPEQRAIRSEKLSEDRSGAQAGGIPGAVSNEPPPIAELTPENNAADGVGGEVGQGGKTRVRQVRNYELSRTVRHEKAQPGAVKRLSVAVVVGIKPATMSVTGEAGADALEEGSEANTQYTEEQLQRLTELVKNAVGFQEGRGDSVSVINATFAKAPEMEELPWWQQDSMISLIKFGVAILIGLFLLFTVILPLIRGAMPRDKFAGAALPAPDDEDSEIVDGQVMGQSLPGGQAGGSPFRLGGGKVQADGNAIAKLFPGGLPDDGNYETYLAAAQYAAAEDPVRAAQVLKRWIQDNV